MRVMRFTADDMAQALRKVREALGPQAVILSTGQTPQGGVEISAAVDEPAPGSPAAAFGAPPQGQAPSAPALSALARRVENLSDLVARHLMVSEAASGFAARPELAPLYQHLSSQELDPQLILQLLEGLEAPGGQGLLPRLAIRLKKMLNLAPALQITPGRPLVWALVGPTGVGKTTTVAKLAASLALRQGLKVGLITVDTYRIAAAEQIMVYGRIMELPTALAASAVELTQALAGMADRDVILVDTVGRSPRDEESLEELQTVLAGAPGLVSHLVLACPTRDADQAEVWQAFARFQPASLIFTKLDETATFGPIINQMVRAGRPVSYLGTGQKVPDDLEAASRESLARRLLPPRPLSPAGASKE